MSWNKKTASQSSDQLLTKGNAVIARNCIAKFHDLMLVSNGRKGNQCELFKDINEKSIASMLRKKDADMTASIKLLSIGHKRDRRDS